MTNFSDTSSHNIPLKTSSTYMSYNDASDKVIESKYYDIRAISSQNDWRILLRDTFYLRHKSDP